MILPRLKKTVFNYNNYCCACTVLFLTPGCVLVRINLTLLLFIYPLSFGMNYYIQKSSGFLLTFIGFEHTGWLVMHSSYTNRKGIGKLLATHDKYTVSYSTIKESQPCTFCVLHNFPAILLPSMVFCAYCMYSLTDKQPENPCRQWVRLAHCRTYILQFIEARMNLITMYFCGFSTHSTSLTTESEWCRPHVYTQLRTDSACVEL